jgi:hypothetical protein
MSVIMTMWIQGDPGELERLAGENPDAIRSISKRAEGHGLIAHRFYGSEGQIMVVDEWPDEQSFQRFFEETRGEIGPMMEQVGASGEPRIVFWRKLETHDEVGWD